MQNPSHPDPPHPDTVNGEDTSAQHHIGLFLFDGVEELDAVGPWEVLAYWTRQHPEDGWSITCLSTGGRRDRRTSRRGLLSSSAARTVASGVPAWVAN